MKHRFIGTWRAVSWEFRPALGEPHYPLGRDAMGMLIYSADGHMAVSLMRPGRVPFESSALFEGSAAEKLAAMDSYASYAGRYEIRGNKVIHHVDFSLFPNWTGTAQERFFKFEQGRLLLYTAPFVKDGMEQAAYLLWEKVGTRL